MTAISPTDAHRRAQDAFTAVLSKVNDDQLGAATPCPQWCVRDLIHHVVSGNQRVVGSESPLPDDAPGLVAAQSSTASAAQAAFETPAALDRDFHLSFGVVPGARLIGLRTADVLTHAWDLARATGQDTDLDPELCQQMLEVSRQAIRPEFRGAGRPFGEEHPCDDGRPAADRLAAFLGRSPD